MKTHSILLMVFGVAMLALLPAPAQADWQGSEVVEDGVRYVRNPEAAPDKTTIEPEELWRRGSDEDDLIFGLPEEILEDADGNVYVLDTQISEIAVFSPSGDHLRTIGREGEGPGEFRSANDMYLRPDGVLGVVQVFPGKVTQILTNGLPADSFRLGESSEGFQLVYGGAAIRDRIVLLGARRSHKGSERVQTNYLKAFDFDGNEIAHYHEISENSQYGGMKFDEKVFANFKRQWSLADDGRMAAVTNFDDYRVHVWKPDGTLAYIIDRPDYQPVKRTSKEKKRFQTVFDGITSWSPGSSFKISETHRAVVQVWFRPNGSLWVLSGKGNWRKDQGVFAVFDVYNTDGRFVQSVTLKCEGDSAKDGFYFSGDRLYRVSDQFAAIIGQFGGDEEPEDDDESDPLQVIAYSLGSREMGMNR